MSEDLLEKEREFHRLNRELGEKTKDLMREVDSFLVSHTTGALGARLNETTTGTFRYERNEPIAAEQGRKSSRGTNGINEEIPPRQTDDGELENLTVEQIVSRDPENSRSEAFVRFLKAKIKLLHDELETIRTEYKKKCNYCKELETDNKKIEDSRLKLHNQTISLKETIAKAEANNANAQTEIQSRNTEISSLKKEIDALKKELKTANQQTNNLDTRLNRSCEDNEKLRNILKLNKIEEKELRDEIRRLQESERLTVKHSEKQKTEILQAFKKQTALVDNLKRQKAHLEASRQIQLIEEEFSKLLDWSPEKT